MTSASVAARVGAIKDRFEGCFGCGRHNPLGLQLDDFAIDGDTVRCSWVPRPEYQSFPDVLHGGVVTTALDEVMAWTAMLLTDHTVVTGTIELRFRRPARCDGVFMLEGRLIEKRGRRVILSGTMCDQQGNEIASAKGMFLTSGSLKEALHAGSAE